MTDDRVDLDAVARAAAEALRAYNEGRPDGVAAFTSAADRLLASLEAERDSLERARSALRSELDTLRRRATVQRAAAAEARTRVAPLQREIDALRADGAEARAALDAGLHGEIETEEKETKRIEEQIRLASEDLAPLRERAQHFAEIADIRLEIEDIQHRQIAAARRSAADRRSDGESVEHDIGQRVAECRQTAATTATRALLLKIGSQITPPGFDRLVAALERLRSYR